MSDVEKELKPTEGELHFGQIYYHCPIHGEITDAISYRPPGISWEDARKKNKIEHFCRLCEIEWIRANITKVEEIKK